MTGSYALTTGEYKNIDQKIDQVLRGELKTYNLFSALDLIREVPFGTKMAESWFYRDVNMPDLVANFEEQPIAEPTRDFVQGYLYGFQQGFYLTEEKIAASRIPGQQDIITDYTKINTEKIAQALETFFLLGSAHYLVNSKVGSVTGLFNASGVNTLEAGDSSSKGGGLGFDDDLTEFGDINVTVDRQMSKLAEDDCKGPYVVFVTDGVARQWLTNKNSTTDETEWELFKRKYMNPFGPDNVTRVTAVIVSKYFGEASDALAVDTQEIMTIDPKPEYMLYKESRKIQRKRWTVKQEGDEAFGIQTKGYLELKNPEAVCISVTLTTDTAL